MRKTFISIIAEFIVILIVGGLFKLLWNSIDVLSKIHHMSYLNGVSLIGLVFMVGVVFLMPITVGRR